MVKAAGRILSLGPLLVAAFLLGCVGQVDNPLQPVSKGGKLYISNSGDSSLLIFGNILNAFGPPRPTDCTVSGSTTTCNLTPTEKIQDLKIQDLIRNPFGVFVDTVNDRLYVADTGRNEILIFNNASTINGVTVPDRVIFGNATTLSFPHGLALDTAKNILYVVNTGGNDVLVFDNASTINGNVAPSRAIDSFAFVVDPIVEPAKKLDRPFGLFVDTAADRLYVANTGRNSILIFNSASTINGSTLPDRTVTFSNTSLSIPHLNAPSGVFVDVANDQLYVTNKGNNSSILVFNNASSPTTTGEIIPARSIPSSPTNLSDPVGISVDTNIRVPGTGTSTGGNTSTTLNDINKSFTPNQFVNFLVEITGGFGAGQVRRIASNTATQLTVSTPWLLTPTSSSTYQIRGDFIYVANQGNNSILVLDNASTVDASFFVTGNPTIASGPSTLEDRRQSFTQDQFVNYLVEITSGTGAGQVRTITSNSSTLLFVSPNWTTNPDTTSTYRIRPGLRTITGTSTTLSSPGGIFLDVTANVLYVTNSRNNSTTVFNKASTSTGDITPDRTISDTGGPVASPGGIFVDVTRDLFYASEISSSILILDHASQLQNTSPPVRRTILPVSGTACGDIATTKMDLCIPFGTSVDTKRDSEILTRLTTDIAATATTIPIASTIGFPTTGTIRIENENISYTGVTATSFTRATRGTDGTTAATHPSGASVSNGGGILYVANTVASSILAFDRASIATGNLAPDRTISGTATTLNLPFGIFVDTENDLLYVANTGANSILVFNNASTTNGPVKPIPPDGRTLLPASGTACGDSTGAKMDLCSPRSVFVDTVNDRLYVANTGANSILVFNNASTTNGPVKPIPPDGRTLLPASGTACGDSTGAKMDLCSPRSVFVDTVNDRLYVANTGANSILVFNNASTTNGPVKPIPPDGRTLLPASGTACGDSTGAKMDLCSPWDVFVDTVNDLLYVTNTGASSILVFDNASAVNGSTPPSRVIAKGTASTDNTTLNVPLRIFVDTTR